MTRLWLGQFARVFVILLVALGTIEAVQDGGAARYDAVLLWSTIAAAISASVTTYWLQKRGCAVPRSRREI